MQADLEKIIHPHIEYPEEGPMREHPGYMLAICPVCWQASFMANTSEALMHSGACCGRKACLETLGVPL